MRFLCDRILIPFIEIELKAEANEFLLSFIYRSTGMAVNLEKMKTFFKDFQRERGRTL